MVKIIDSIENSRDILRRLRDKTVASILPPYMDRPISEDFPITVIFNTTMGYTVHFDCPVIAKGICWKHVRSWFSEEDLIFKMRMNERNS